MLDIGKFEKLFLEKFRIKDDNARRAFLENIVENYSFELEDNSYQSLKTMLESSDSTFTSGKNTVFLSKEESSDHSVQQYYLYIDLYENAQSNKTLKKRAYYNDFSYSSSRSYIKEFNILEFNADGSVYYINLVFKDYTDTAFKLNIKYYSADTINLLGDEKEKIDVYESLDSYCIFSDDSISASASKSSFKEVLLSMNESKKELANRLTLKRDGK